MSVSTIESIQAKVTTAAPITKKHLVDPKSKEFVHELMRCFNKGRQVAIKEFHAAQVAVPKAS